MKTCHTCKQYQNFPRYFPGFQHLWVSCYTGISCTVCCCGSQLGLHTLCVHIRTPSHSIHWPPNCDGRTAYSWSTFCRSPCFGPASWIPFGATLHPRIRQRSERSHAHAHAHVEGVEKQEEGGGMAATAVRGKERTRRGIIGWGRGGGRGGGGRV